MKGVFKVGKRKKLTSKGSKKMFTKHAVGTHVKNVQKAAVPMRGGFRI